MGWPFCFCGNPNINVVPTLIIEAPEVSDRACEASLRQFCGRSLPVVVHVLLQTRKGRCLLAEQSFGMYIISVHHIVFELCLLEKEERKKTNKIDIFTFGFLDHDKG